MRRLYPGSSGSPTGGKHPFAESKDGRRKEGSCLPWISKFWHFPIICLAKKGFSRGKNEISPLFALFGWGSLLSVSQKYFWLPLKTSAIAPPWKDPSDAYAESYNVCKGHTPAANGFHHCMLRPDGTGFIRYRMVQIQIAALYRMNTAKQTQSHLVWMAKWFRDETASRALCEARDFWKFTPQIKFILPTSQKVIPCCYLQTGRKQWCW